MGPRLRGGDEQGAGYSGAKSLRRGHRHLGAVRFLDDNGGGALVTVSHWNKLLKGALVRHIVATPLIDPDGLREFTHPQGYRYRPELTVIESGRTVVSLVADRTTGSRPAP